MKLIDLAGLLVSGVMKLSEKKHNSNAVEIICHIAEKALNKRENCKEDIVKFLDNQLGPLDKNLLNLLQAVIIGLSERAVEAK